MSFVKGQQTDSGSTVPRRQLGRYLRQWRERAGITIRTAAEHLDCSTQKIWRIEKGITPVRSPDVRTLCELYRTDAETIHILVGLGQGDEGEGWWQSSGDAVPVWFQPYVGLERSASRIRKFEPALIDGLLQAPAYMECVIRAERPELPEQILRDIISVKETRRALLTRHFPPPPTLEVIIWEAVLRCPMDVPGALEQQLFHLLKASELPNVSIRVLPFASGAHQAAPTGAIVILEFPEVERADPEPPTVYLESLTGALYLDRAAEFEAYDRMWSNVAVLTLDEDASRKMITAAMRELNAGA